jgi:hypothetical protein
MLKTAGRDIVDGAIGLLERFPEVQDDPNWWMHVRVAMQMVFGTLSNILINRPGPLEIDDDATAEELGKAAIRCLRLEKLDWTPPKRRPRRLRSGRNRAPGKSERREGHERPRQRGRYARLLDLRRDSRRHGRRRLGDCHLTPVFATSGPAIAIQALI